MDGKRVKGRVMWFSPEKGFGFIRIDKQVDIFVYHTEILSDGFKSLNRDQMVEFEIVQTDRGPEAKKVKIL